MGIKIKVTNNYNIDPTISIEDYTARHFVDYFNKVYYDAFNNHYHIATWGKDCSIMKRIQSKFHLRDKENQDILDFISWVLETHKSRYNGSKPIMIGLLESYLKGYLERKGWAELGLIRHTDETNLDQEMKDWLAQIRKESEEGEN